MSDELRPDTWDEYIGQERLKHELEVRITAAVSEGRPLEPVLLIGPPGAGKTALAEIIAKKLNEPIEKLIMPVSIKTIQRVVNSFEGVLYLDEIHALGKGQEALLPLLEFNYMQADNGRRIQAGFLTIVATTTEEQSVLKTLRRRFRVRPDYDPYTDDEMARIILGMAKKAQVDMLYDVALKFGVACCGIPASALDFVQGYKALYVTNRYAPTADEVLDFLRITTDGLTRKHMQYLEVLDALGGTRGLRTITSLMRVSESVVIDLERLLVTKGLVTFGDQGRELTREGASRVHGVHRPRRGTEGDRAA